MVRPLVAPKSIAKKLSFMVYSISNLFGKYKNKYPLTKRIIALNLPHIGKKIVILPQKKIG
jgi:hypothetical protein